jgi:hypothetical protein
MLGWSLSLMGSGSTLVWAWGSDGHQIVARIAANNLTPAARTHVAQLLGVAKTKTAVANAMAAASIRPDTEFRNSNPETKPWHFIDIWVMFPIC